jgi:hypothetical protein
MVGDREEMLSIVETLNEFFTMLLGHELKMYNDNKIKLI